MILDLFAGPGGWDEGSRLAGHDGPLVGLEWDLPACRTAMAAGHARVCADVAGYPTGPFVGKTWGLILSPPCPTFSAAGLGAGKTDEPLVRERIRAFSQGEVPPDREWADERSLLTAEPMRWAIALRPRWVALEQVPPVLPLWQVTAHYLRQLGYHAWCGILSAEQFGVPQTRKRAILMASLDGPVGPPVVTHQAYRSGREPVTEPDLFGEPLPVPLSMADALGWGMTVRPSTTLTAGSGRKGGPDPMDGGSGGRGSLRREQENRRWVMRSNYGTGGDHSDQGERDTAEPAATVTGKIDRNMWVLRGDPQANGCERGTDQPADTVFGSRPGNMTWRLRNGTQGNACVPDAGEPAGTVFFGERGNAVDWVQDRPSTTVCGDPRLGSPGHKDREGGEPQFGPETVRVTVAEAGVLQSFRADYPWTGTKTQQYCQVGNCIPPLLAKAILQPLIKGDSR